MRPENGSAYNYLAEARADLQLPSNVILNDVSLREGLQASQRPVDSSVKVELAKLIDDAGLQQIQVGYLGRSETDRQAVRAMRDVGIRAALEGISSIAAPSWRQELETALTVSPDRLNLILPSSDIRLRSLSMTRGQMLARAVEAVSFAHQRCPRISFSPVDTTRTHLMFLKEVLAAVSDAGADRFYLIDTAGVISPVGMRYLAREMCKISTISLAVHCHDDFGLAVANGLAALEQGVQVVDVCINGMGKRAGNIALEEIALALVMFHDLDLDLRFDRLYGLSQFTAQVTGVPIPVNKAIVGRDAFDLEVDAQLRGAQGHHGVGVFNPALVGHPFSGDRE